MMETLVKEEFRIFLSTNVPGVSLSQLDEIALDYIVSVLEQLGEDECFDVEEFLEVMAAYIPDFEEVNRDSICSWMFDLAGKMAKTQDVSSIKCPSSISQDIPVPQKEKCVELDWSTETPNSKQDGCSLQNNKETDTDGCRTSDRADNTDNLQHCCVSDPSFSAHVSALSEIFPDACSLEVKRCLLVANGDAEQAARLMLLKRTDARDHEDSEDGGQETHLHLVDSEPKAHRPSAKRQECAVDDQKNAKEVMMSRYGFVDVETDERSHRPAIPKQAPRKLVRYRENQVVSTRGERFSQLKREDTDEMKKTYVNLKPARKYRFH